jgi:hypothetical protein
MSMIKDNAGIAKAFYTSMSEKNVVGLEQYLHDDIEFIAPLAKTYGKEAYIENAKKFMGFFSSLAIRTVCDSNHEATVVYDLNFPESIGSVPTVALMNLNDGLITRIELFYDARPFER